VKSSEWGYRLGTRFSMTSRVLCAYVTVPGRDSAEHIARTLVEEQLVACANVINGVTSFFHWNDSLNVAQEAVLLMKTDLDREQELVSRVCELHPYEEPCVVTWRLHGGSPGFLDWVCCETRLPTQE